MSESTNVEQRQDLAVAHVAKSIGVAPDDLTSEERTAIRKGVGDEIEATLEIYSIASRLRELGRATGQADSVRKAMETGTGREAYGRTLQAKRLVRRAEEDATLRLSRIERGLPTDDGVDAPTVMLKKAESLRQFLDVPCPIADCGAKPGAPCTNDGVATSPHSDRVVAHYAAADAGAGAST